MTNKNIFFACFLHFFLWSNECSKDMLKLDDKCYYKKHIDVLQDFIDSNPNIKERNPLKIGHQEWTQNRLTYLYLGDYNITIVPDSIGLLRDLNALDLRKNKIKNLPESICNIYPYYTQINLNENHICPPYPYCFDYIGNQNIKNCDSFKCPNGFIKINEECYNEQHISILQEIININPSLSGLKPLELGNNIGYQIWKNGILTNLSLINNQLTALPDNISDIYNDMQLFDIANNLICPPYPPCFSYIGNQNTEHCNEIDKMSIPKDYIVDNNLFKSDIILSELNSKKFNNDILVLQSFIDNNESLLGKNPLEIGKQEWQNMKLINLDLSSNELTYIPAKICDIYSNLNSLDLSNNFICPPYPQCIEYIDFQNKASCGEYICPKNYIDINGECYLENNIKVLKDIIDSNPSLATKLPLEIITNIDENNWINGKLNKLLLVNKQLINIPESICDIYKQLSVFDINNNFICPPYPECIENIGFQNINECTDNIKLSCPNGYVNFDKECYYFDDLQVLIDLTKLNLTLEGFHPLLIGYQVWKNNHLQQLNLDNLQISNIPSSINKLTKLEYLTFNNNKIKSLPNSLCEIYPNLQNLQFDNNFLCPPYLKCFDFIANQNTNNCESRFCPYDNIEIDGKCYFEKDISILNDFINQNSSLAERKPLEIGIQKWKNMRLQYLYLGANQLTIIPESICDILPNLKTLNISQNNICESYPKCIENYIGQQNINNCP